MKILFIAFFLFSSIAIADNESVNQCKDKEKIAQWEDLIKKYKKDLGIVHLYALRTGLCQAIDDGKVELDDAIDVFDTEHHKLFDKRLTDENQSHKQNI
jgi:hypothetical protein